MSSWFRLKHPPGFGPHARPAIRDARADAETGTRPVQVRARRPRLFGSRALAALVLALATAVPVAVASVATAPPPEKVERSASIEPVEHVKEGEELLVQSTNGSIELRGDPKATEVRVEAHFEVDGEDEKDVTRRAQLVRLYAERAPDGAVVVDAVFPGKAMPRDRARIVVVAPKLARATLRSASGAIDVRSTTGLLRLTTRSGTIDVRDHAGPVEAQSTSGAIRMSGLGEGVRATTGSGGVEVRLADGNDHPTHVESKSGAVLFEAGSGFDGAIDATTTSGEISIDDPGKRARVPTQGAHRARVEVGAATVHSEIQTTSGAIAIRVRG